MNFVDYTFLFHKDKIEYDEKKSCENSAYSYYGILRII